MKERTQWIFFHSGSGDQTCFIQAEHQGSSVKHTSVVVQVVDTGSDIMIMGMKPFKKIADIAHLWKRDFRPADKTPGTYGRQLFTLHGKMSLSISFGEREMVTPVYIKMDSEDHCFWLKEFAGSFCCPWGDQCTASEDASP